MGYTNFDPKNTRDNNPFRYKVAKNSVDVSNGTLVKITTTGIDVVGAGDTIEGVSSTNKVFTSDNFTVAKDTVGYRPTSALETYQCPVTGGTSIFFDANLVTSNVINMNVNGVAMTPITFTTSSNTTLGLIAAQLASQFPTLIAAAVGPAGTNTISITVQPGQTVTITGIAVTAGGVQANGSQIDTLTLADIGKYYDVTSTQRLDATTESTTTGQLRLEQLVSQSSAIVSIVNL